MPQIKCVFFDRDGIVNESPGPGRYVTRWEDFHLMPEFVECLRVVTRRGYSAIIVTNQRCVAKGLVTAEQVEDMHRRLQALLRRKYRLSLLDIIYCPHDVGECSCRKPAPGMLLTMAAKHAIDLRASWMVGDTETDVEAGRLAGCHTILIGMAVSESKAEVRIASMKDLPAMLESLL